MEYIQKQFIVNYTINGGKVRSGAAGEFENQDTKKLVKYSAKVLIVMENTYEEYNELTDCMDTEEETLIFRIDSSSNVSAGILVKKLREFFKLGGILNIEAGQSRYDSRSKLSYVRAIQDADTFIPMLDTEMKKMKASK